MFKTIKTAAQLSIVAAQCAKYGVKHRKEFDRLDKAAYADAARIAASQAKIGSYKPAAIPVQVWA